MKPLLSACATALLLVASTIGPKAQTAFSSPHGDGLRGLSPATVPAQPVLKWQLTLPQGIGYAGITFGDSGKYLYFQTFGMNRAQVFKVDAASGTVVWSTDPGVMDFGTICTAGVTVDENAQRLYVGGRYDAKPNGEAFIACLDARDGCLIWRTNRSQIARVSIAIGDGAVLLSPDKTTLYLKDTSDNVAALSTTDGSVKWVYVGDYVNPLPARELQQAETLGPVWRDPVSGKTRLVLTNDSAAGSVIAIQDEGTSATQAWVANIAKGQEFRSFSNVVSSPDEASLYVNAYSDSGNPVLSSLDAATGAVKWTVSSTSETPFSFYAPPCVGADGTIYAVGHINRSADRGGIAAISPDGKVKWTVDTGGGEVKGWPTVTAGKTVYVTDQAETKASAVLSAVQDNGATGSILWQTPIGASWYGRATPTVGPDGTVYVASVSLNNNQQVLRAYAPGDATGLTRTQRVSVSADGAEGMNPISDAGAITPDGQWVAFASDANDLVPGDTNAQTDVFVRNLNTGSGEQVSRPNTGGASNGASRDPAISDDGRYVAFTSWANNLVAGDNNNADDVFVRDRQTGVVERVSVGTNASQSNGNSRCAGISANGRYVLFESDASNLVSYDTNNVTDMFVRDRAAGTTERVSVATDGTQGNGASYRHADISADGRYVVFRSDATNLVAGDTNGRTDIFMRDRVLRATVRVSVTVTGAQANDSSEACSLTADGRYVAFSTASSNMDPGRWDGGWNAYVWDRTTGVSVLEGLAYDGSRMNGYTGVRGISADGRYLVLESWASNAVAGGPQGLCTIYVRDRTTGTNTRVSRAADGGNPNAHSWGIWNIQRCVGAGPRVLYRSSASNIVPGDINNALDVFAYDASIGKTTRVSAAPGNVETGGGYAELPALSADGRYVTFSSNFCNLVPNDANNSGDIFVRDTRTNVLERVSVGPNGEETQGNSWGSSISADGRYVAFRSWGSYWFPSQTNWDENIYVRDRLLATTALVTKGLGGTAANGGSHYPRISADGRFVAFVSYAGNLVAEDTNGQPDIFRADLSTGEIRLVSATATGVPGNGSSDFWYPAISADGRYVAFNSSATNLVSGDTNNRRDIFVKDMRTGAIERVSVSTAGEQGDGDSSWPALSADGRYVAFYSFASNLAPGDTNHASDIFVRDRALGLTACVSRTSGGAVSDNGNCDPSLSADGRYVAFKSWAGNLVPDDTNANCDVMVYDTVTKETRRASVSDAGEEGNATSDGVGPVLSADGQWVAYASSSSNLVQPDRNTAWDVFLRGPLTTATSSLGFGIQPEGALAGKAMPQVTALVRWAGGQVVRTFGGIVSISIKPGSGAAGATLSGAVGVYAQSGVATFDNLSIDKPGKGYVLVVSAAGLPSAESVPFDVVDAPASVSFDTQPAGNMAGRTLRTQPVVSVRDAGGQVITGFSLPVTLRIKPGTSGAVLSGSVTVSAVNGVATFQNLSINVKGTYWLDAVVGGTVLASSASFAMTPKPSALAFTTQPQVGVPGVPLAVAPVVAAQDETGDTAVDFDGAISLALKPGAGTPGAVLSGALTVPCVGGVAAFPGLAIDKAGRGYALIASSASLTPATSSTFSVGDATAAGTIRASIAYDGFEAAKPVAYVPSLSADGKLMVFESDASNLVPNDTNGTRDIFLKNLETGDVSLVSIGPDGKPMNTYSESPSISSGGRYAVFQSESGDWVDSGYSYYPAMEVWLRDLQEGVTRKVSVAMDGSALNNDAYTPKVTPDGRYVCFVSAATNVVSGVAGGVAQVYLRDMTSGTTVLVSASEAGVPGDKRSAFPQLSADGRYVVYISSATNLVSGDTNAQDDVFVRDMLSGGVTCVSVNAAGTSVGASNWASISDDGRLVAFESFSSDLVPGDTNGEADVFIRDLQAGTTSRASVSSAGVQADGGSQLPQLSRNGRFVSFVSWARNLVASSTSGGGDVYLRDLQTGTTRLVSVRADGVQANNWSDNGYVSDDGRKASFQSQATNLVSGDRNNTYDVFVKDMVDGSIVRASASPEGREHGGGASYSPSISNNGRYVVFDSIASNLVADDTNGIGDIFVRDTVLGDTTRVNVSSTGAQADWGYSGQAEITPDGRFVAFASNADYLVAGDTNYGYDIFIRDRANGATRRVSLTSTGAQSTGASYNPSISANGTRIAFASYGSDLVANDSNGKEDVFLRDTVAGTTTLISVGMSGVPANGSSYNARISGNGRYVAFLSDASNLVPDDTNGQEDMFLRDTQTETTSLVSVAFDGRPANGLSYGRPCLSADGRYVAFASSASNLAPGDANGHGDVFVRDMRAGVTTRVSVGISGQEADAVSYWPSISADGRFVAFAAYGDSLVAGVSGSGTNVYVRDTARNTMIALSRAMDGTLDGNADYPAISSDGKYVAYESISSSVVPDDRNGVSDIFVVPMPVMPEAGYSWRDAAAALRVAGGLTVSTATDRVWLDLEKAAPAGLNVLDAIRIARKAAGLEANP